jgi:DNA-3-methyladenine glycosylase II
MKPRYWTRATRELSARDPVLKKLIATHKGITLGSRGDAFQTLARAIVGQQISVKAAQSVWDRFAAAHDAAGDRALHHRDAALMRLVGAKIGIHPRSRRALCRWPLATGTLDAHAR